VAVKEWNDEIIFVRQVTPGASERSFGIQVARLAGLPDSVVGRAKEILAGLETGSRAAQGKAYEPEPANASTLTAEPEVPSEPSIEESSVSTNRSKVRRSEKADPSQLELF
jgi:DNA mismatch repair protein MutS